MYFALAMVLSVVPFGSLLAAIAGLQQFSSGLGMLFMILH